MKRMALLVSAGIVATLLAGCAVEVPMSALRLSPPLLDEKTPPPDRDAKAAQQKAGQPTEGAGSQSDRGGSLPSYP